MEFIEGVITQFRYQGQNSWRVAMIEDNRGKETKIVGNIPARIGDTILVGGEWIQHPRHGLQLKIEEFSFSMARSERGILGYLDRLPNIGPVRAATIYRTFGEKTFEVIENEPERLTEAPGITPRMVKDIHAAFMADKAYRDRIVFLKQFGLTDGKVAKILATYGPELEAVLKSNPYRMIEDIDGFGFKTADEIARAAGMAKDDPTRIRAGVLYALVEAAGEGHTCLPLRALLSVAVKLLSAPVERVKKEIDGLAGKRKLVMDGSFVFLPVLQRAEVSAARCLATLAMFQTPQAYRQGSEQTHEQPSEPREEAPHVEHHAAVA